MYLNCHTYFSLKYGILSPTQLLEEAKKNGVNKLIITDINNTSAILDTLRQAPSFNIEIAVGIDFRNGIEQKYVAIANNNEGFYEINQHLSLHLHTKQPFSNQAPQFQNAVVIYPFNTIKYTQLRHNEMMGIQLSQINKLLFSIWKQQQDKLVLLQPVTFRHQRDFNTHRLLRSIDNRIVLSKLSSSQQTQPNEIMLSNQYLLQQLHSYPTIIKNTNNILLNATLKIPIGQGVPHINQRCYTNNEELDFKFIKKLCYGGLQYRYEKTTAVILQRLELELTTIKKMGFVAYFLIAWKIVKYARQKGFFYVGRGSGANSLVAYLLRITDVDPIELDLYFERFINLYRKNPPDFDLDFSWKERQDVTKFIFSRFKHTALLACYVTFQYKSVIHELGKVFGLPAQEIKKLQKDPKEADEIGKIVLKYSQCIHGLPSHLSVHAGGILIAQEPIHRYSATFLPPKGFATTQFDMHTAEDVGLYKFDILGQRGLAKIKDTILILKNNQGIEVDLHNMKKIKNDHNANKLLKQGNAIGCFYVESPAMRMLLHKLQVCDYLGLVAASSVIRPGVSQSGMMREYILRKRNHARRKWAQQTFPKLYNLMPETFGVMVYQEDVLKVAHYFAGLSLGEADVLRRGMSGKFRSRKEFEQVKQKFFENCKNKNIALSTIQDVWTQIESFAGYAFAKGHSASYAVESYQCLFLKAYFPLEFMVAVINNGGGFYSCEQYLHEARLQGATIHLPCVNHSQENATIHDTHIYLGLGMIAGIEDLTIKNLLAERSLNGSFTSLYNFIDTVSVSSEQLRLLIRANVFQFLQKEKKALLWEAHFLIGKKKKNHPEKRLFDSPVKTFKIPALWQDNLESAYDEIELFGFPVTTSPFSLLQQLPKQTIAAKDFTTLIGKTITIAGYRVHIKSVRTKNGKYMYFGTFIDVAGNWIDTVTFPDIARHYPIIRPGCYLLKGVVTEEFGYYSLQIQWLKQLPAQQIGAPSTRLKQYNRTGTQ